MIRKSDLRAAIRRANETPGPYLLEVMVPHIEHVLPMIPVSGGSWSGVYQKGVATKRTSLLMVCVLGEGDV